MPPSELSVPCATSSRVNNHPRSRESGRSPISQICARHALWPGSPFSFFFSSSFRSPLIAPFLSQVLRDPTRLITRVGVPLFRDPCPPCPAHEREARRRNQLVRFFQFFFHSLTTPFLTCTWPPPVCPLVTRRPFCCVVLAFVVPPCRAALTLLLPSIIWPLLSSKWPAHIPPYIPFMQPLWTRQ
jgi:hypothetical protein